MHHVMKGMMAIRIDDTRGFEVSRNTIQGLENLSLLPYGDCETYHPGSSEENGVIRQAGDIRGISAAATRGYDSRLYSNIADNILRQMETLNGDYVIGIDIQGESEGINVNRNDVDLMPGVGVVDDKYIALRVRENVDGPTIKVGADNRLMQKLQNDAPKQEVLRKRNFNHPYIPPMYVYNDEQVDAASPFSPLTLITF